MKLNLDDDNVFEKEMTVTEVRQLIEMDDLPDEIMTGFDEAQGYVHMGKGPASYLVIKITGDKP